MNITDRVKTFEDACLIDGIDPVEAVPFAEPKTADQIAINGFSKAIIIIRVLNEGWVPDYDNYNERKYEPWFDLRSSAAGGSGFSFYDYYFDYSASLVGSRLVTKNRELWQYAGKQFSDIFKDFIAIPKG